MPSPSVPPSPSPNTPQSPSPSVRPVQPADIPGILTLIAGIYAEYDCTLDAEGEDRHLLDPAGYFGRTGGAFWVVEADPAVRASAGATVPPPAATTAQPPSLEGRGRGRVDPAADQPPDPRDTPAPGGIILATAGVLLHPEAGELKTLYVHPTLRRHGWGRRLTEMAIAHARAAGRRRFVLWSDTRFRDAHRLYRSMGFSEFGLRILGDSNNSTEFGFELRLD